MKSILYPTLLIFHSVFISLGNDSKFIKYICIVLLSFYLFGKRKLFLNKKYYKINTALCIFCISVLASSINQLFINLPRDFNAVSPFSGVLLVMCILCTFFFMEYLNEKHKIDEFYILLYNILFLYLLLNDVLLLQQIPAVSGLESPYVVYLLGNKFVVAYLHIFLAVLYYQKLLQNQQCKNKGKIFLFYFHLLVAFIISYLVECSTAIIGIFVLFVFKTFYKKLYFLFSPLGAILLVICFSSFFLFYEYILSLPIVQTFIVDILHEDLTLTGRTFIYANMLDIMQDEPWLGYGNGSASIFTNYYINMPNTQNGLLNDYIDWGIIGCICFLFLISVVIKQSDKTSKKINPFVCLIYMYIVLSSIEITLGLLFLSILPFCIFRNNKFNNRNFYSH